jgi:hypothetical protein
MRGEVNYAFALMGSLSEEQRAKATLSPKRGRIAAGPGRDGHVPEPTGFKCSDMSDGQKALLKILVGEYVGSLPEPYAKKRMKQLEQELDQMVFAWHGPMDNPSDVSYRVQGPSLIIEYACQDLGGDPLDHLHSMYRDPTNEYGAAFTR